MAKWVVRGLAAAILAAGLGLPTLDASARTNRALLVGVTEYPSLPKGDWLQGPANDVQLVRDFLMANGTAPFAAENIALLAQGVDGAALPTRAAILEALAKLAGDAEEDDFVYIQFSGHGSRQPALVPGSEQDGMDEIFLPYDTGPWDSSGKSIANVIADDEIRAAFDAIRDKGAFIWVTFDACHSGTATRAVGTREKERKVSEASLGIPPEAMAAAKAEASRGLPARQNALDVEEADGGENSKRGGMVAFFAAQTVETTPELPLPEDAADAKVYGLFTHTLISKLAENPGVSYRQLSQSILQHYAGLNRTKPTPLFEGDLDAPVFGVEAGDAILQWKIEKKDGEVGLPAGLLHRVTPGTKLAILPSPLSQMSDAIGYLDVRSATNLTSRLLPANYQGRAAVRMEQIPDGAYARIAEMALNFELAVATPPPAPGLESEAELARSALAAIAADGKTPVKLKIVGPDERADIRFAVMREADVPGAPADASGEPSLWFLPPSGDILLDKGRRPPSIVIGPGGGERLREAMAENLVLMSKAMNLSRLAGASDFRTSEVSVGFLIQREGEEKIEPIEEGKVPFLHPGDSIFMQAENKSRRPVDVNILYVGSDYKIYTAAEPIRLHPREELPETGLFTVSDGSFGMERLVAIMTEALPQTPTLDLGYLAQPAVRQVTRSAGAPEGFAGLLDDIAKAPATREVKRFADKRGTKGAVLVFPMETSPREE